MEQLVELARRGLFHLRKLVGMLWCLEVPLEVGVCGVGVITRISEETLELDVAICECVVPGLLEDLGDAGSLGFMPWRGVVDIQLRLVATIDFADIAKVLWVGEVTLS